MIQAKCTGGGNAAEVAGRPIYIWSCFDVEAQARPNKARLSYFNWLTSVVNRPPPTFLTFQPIRLFGSTRFGLVRLPTYNNSTGYITGGVDRQGSLRLPPIHLHTNTTSGPCWCSSYLVQRNSQCPVVYPKGELLLAVEILPICSSYTASESFSPSSPGKVVR